MQDNNIPIREDGTIQELLNKFPADIADSFSEKQLLHLKTALVARKWGKHTIDIRGTFPLPFVSSRYYYVLLFGKNYRELSRQEKQISLLSKSVFISGFLLFCALLGLLILYLVKSALGIDLLPGYSLGVWGWFKSLW